MGRHLLIIIINPYYYILIKYLILVNKYFQEIIQYFEIIENLDFNQF